MTPFNYGNLDLGFLEMQDSVFKGGVELASHRDGGPWQRVLAGVLVGPADKLNYGENGYPSAELESIRTRAREGGTQ